MIKNLRTSSQHSDTVKGFLLLFALIFIRFIYYGLEYFPQLDDYIQHHNYAYGNPDIVFSLADMGLLAARPLAAVLDVTLWSTLFPIMIVGVALISICFAISGVIFYGLARRYFGCTPLFRVIYALLPLTFEGVYWVSASSRVVVGIFFAALSIWFFERFCRLGGRWHLPLYVLTQALAFGLYEQITLLSLTLTGLCFLYMLYMRNRRGLFALLSIIPCLLYFLVTSVGSASSIYTSRTELIFPVSAYYFKVFLPEVVRQMYHTFISLNLATLLKGTYRGLSIMVADGALLYLVAILLLCWLFYRFIPRETEDRGNSALWWGCLVGFLLGIAPLTLFFIVANPWFGARGTVASLCGVAIFFDCLFRLILCRLPNRDQLLRIFATALSLVCCVAAVSELHDYRQTTINDQSIGAVLLTALEDIPSTASVGVLGIEITFLEDQNYFYHEHIHGVSESSWAMCGMLEALRCAPGPTVTPLPITTPTYYAYNKSSKTPDCFDYLFYYSHEDGTLIPITYQEISEGSYLFYDLSGNLLASMYDENNIGYTTLAPDDTL